MSKSEKICVVDDLPVNLLVVKQALQNEYDIKTVKSGKGLLSLLASWRPDLILLDIEMPFMSGFEVLSHLKADSGTAGIPVIILSSNNNLDDEAKCFSLGAEDFIHKPFYPPLLRRRLDRYFRLESQGKTIRDYEQKIQTLVRNNHAALGNLQSKLLKTIVELVERREEISGGHAERTYKYIEVLLDVLVKNKIYDDIVNSWKKDLFLQSTLLYDLGKISVKDAILLKPDKLADYEYDEIKKHPLMGVKIIEEIRTGMDNDSAETDVLDYAKVLAGFHHEKWDGTGYPYGLKGYNIPLPGRLMAIADVYDALIAQKPYKKSYTHEEAAAIISRGKGTHFDPALVDAFIASADQFKTISNQGSTCAQQTASLKSSMNAGF
jgi:putative two-component system response regulator